MAEDCRALFPICDGIEHVREHLLMMAAEFEVHGEAVECETAAVISAAQSLEMAFAFNDKCATMSAHIG